jgi:hypothetical protein
MATLMTPSPVQALIISDDALRSLRRISCERPHILQAVIFCGGAGVDLIRPRSRRVRTSSEAAAECERQIAASDRKKQDRKKQARRHHQDPPDHANTKHS